MGYPGRFLIFTKTKRYKLVTAFWNHQLQRPLPARVLRMLRPLLLWRSLPPSSQQQWPPLFLTQSLCCQHQPLLLPLMQLPRWLALLRQQQQPLQLLQLLHPSPLNTSMTRSLIAKSSFLPTTAFTMNITTTLLSATTRRITTRRECDNAKISVLRILTANSGSSFILIPARPEVLIHLPASWITSHTTQCSYSAVMSTTTTWLIIKILHQHNSGILCVF